MAELEIELPEVNEDVINALQKKSEKLLNNIATIHNNPIWIWGKACHDNKIKIIEQIFKQRYKK